MTQLEKKFAGGFIRAVSYEEKTRILQVSLETGRVFRYREVPEWVFKKLVASPSPRSFWEDAIRDEYTSSESKSGPAADSARSALDDLFKS